MQPLYRPLSSPYLMGHWRHRCAHLAPVQAPIQPISIPILSPYILFRLLSYAAI